jgi:hypothetical protein
MTETIKDKLAEMLKLQKEFQIKTGFDPAIHELSSAIMTEGGELWATEGKWWKHYIENTARGLLTKEQDKEYLEKLGVTIHDHQLEESIDIFHFLLCVWIKLGVTADEVFEAYCSKMKVNVKRQDDKY